MTPDPERREARRFEPPPWERDRFEELEKRTRAEDQSSEQRVAPATEPKTGQDTEEVEKRSTESDPGSGDGAGSGSSREGSSADEVEAMLIALRSEEPKALEGAWKLGMAASVFVTTLGLMLVIWGSVAMARAASAGAAGVMGSAIMGVMGALFAALGVWLGVRSLRQRGVL